MYSCFSMLILFLLLYANCVCAMVMPSHPVTLTLPSFSVRHALLLLLLLLLGTGKYKQGQKKTNIKEMKKRSQKKKQPKLDRKYEKRIVRELLYERYRKNKTRISPAWCFGKTKMDSDSEDEVYRSGHLQTEAHTAEEGGGERESENKIDEELFSLLYSVEDTDIMTPNIRKHMVCPEPSHYEVCIMLRFSARITV